MDSSRWTSRTYLSSTYFLIKRCKCYTNDIFVEFIEKFLVPKYTDAEEIPGKRVIIEACSGPGSWSIQCKL